MSFQKMEGKKRAEKKSLKNHYCCWKIVVMLSIYSWYFFFTDFQFFYFFWLFFMILAHHHHCNIHTCGIVIFYWYEMTIWWINLEQKKTEKIKQPSSLYKASITIIIVILYFNFFFNNISSYFLSILNGRFYVIWCFFLWHRPSEKNLKWANKLRKWIELSEWMNWRNILTNIWFVKVSFSSNFYFFPPILYFFLVTYTLMLKYFVLYSL